MKAPCNLTLKEILSREIVHLIESITYVVVISPLNEFLISNCHGCFGHMVMVNYCGQNSTSIFLVKHASNHCF